MKFKNVIDDLRQQYENQPLNNQKDAEDMASEAAHKCLQHLNGFPIPMGDVLRSLGFVVWVRNFTNKSISGVMALHANEKFPMAIGVNVNDSHGHQCFTLAHELGHYIFDIQDKGKELITIHYNTSIDNENNLSELRANKFAVYLLMPQNEFCKIIEEAKRRFSNRKTRIEYAALAFDVSITAIQRRLEELKIAV